MALQYYPFGHHRISESEVFYTSQLSFVFVNNRPASPDVLVCPKREVKRVADLTADESCDLWLTAQKIGRLLETYHNASSLIFGIQDGPQSGQTVAHVHIHIIPRKDGDNDDIDDENDLKERQQKRRLDEEDRQKRSLAEMAAEADEYRKLLS